MTERKATDKLQEATERLAWEIVSTSIRLDELLSIWAKMIGITGPQWMIMTVLANAEDRNVGLPVGAVSRALRVDQSSSRTASTARSGVRCPTFPSFSKCWTPSGSGWIAVTTWPS